MSNDNDLDPRRSTTIGWIVLALIVVSLPIGAAWYLHTGAEPYPALSQPGFQRIYGADGVFSGQSTSISVVFADGTTAPLPTESLFPDSTNQALPVIESIASHPDLDTPSREKVRAELDRLLPGRNISYLKIERIPLEYRVRENRKVPLGAADISFVDLRTGHATNP